MAIKMITSEIPQPLANYSEASQADDLIFAAGQLASDWKDGVPKEASPPSEFSVLHFGHQVADGIHPQKLEKDVQGRRHLLGQRRQGAGFLVGSQPLRRVRRSMAQSLQGATPTHNGRYDWAVSKDTLVEIDLIATLPSRPISIITSEAPEAAGQLFRGNPRRRSRFRRRPTRQRLQDRRSHDMLGAARTSRSTDRTSSFRLNIHSEKPQLDTRSCREFAGSRR